MGPPRERDDRDRDQAGSRRAADGRRGDGQAGADIKELARANAETMQAEIAERLQKERIDRASRDAQAGQAAENTGPYFETTRQDASAQYAMEGQCLPETAAVAH
jgi:hypothetical protein